MAELCDCMSIWRMTRRTKNCPFDLSLLQKDGVAAPPFVSLVSSLSSTAHTLQRDECTTRDLIEQIDWKWSRGVWVNQSNIVKQFLGHEGISLACVELITSHSPQPLPGFQGQGPRPSPAPWRTTHAPLSMLHCLSMPHHSPSPLLPSTTGMMD